VCNIVVKKFTFAISSPDEFLLYTILAASLASSATFGALDIALRLSVFA